MKVCKAPDGSYWALQQWQRELKNYGVPSTGENAAKELRVSHWTGGLPVLEITTDRSNQGLDHLFGTFKYAGKGVYGFASTSAGVPKDSFGRNIYVDTFDSAYGSGWKRENSFLTHATNGSFCYLFAKHGEHPTGDGEKYRATVIGPGVTPDAMWSGKPAGTLRRGPGRCGRRDQGDERPRLQAGLIERRGTRRIRVQAAAHRPSPSACP